MSPDLLYPHKDSERAEAVKLTDTPSARPTFPFLAGPLHVLASYYWSLFGGLNLRLSGRLNFFCQVKFVRRIPGSAKGAIRLPQQSMRNVAVFIDGDRLLEILLGHNQVSLF